MIHPLASRISYSGAKLSFVANKRERHDTILEIVGSRVVSSQEDLRKLLLQRGWDVTQATLSRDLRELRLARVPTPEGARYAITDGSIEESRAALDTLLPQLFLRIDGVSEMLVLRTVPGGAQPIAAALDGEGWADILGTVGGDDTILIICRSVGARVICVAADIGQGSELDGVRAKAIASGAEECYVEDLRQEFVEKFVWPTLRAGAIYGRKYLLGTSMARPLIARRQVEIARKVGADALAHGCTGNGNDQVRFELTYAAFAPDLPIIAPWREWDIRSREDAIAYAESHRIPIAATKEKIYSRDRT